MSDFFNFVNNCELSFSKNNNEINSNDNEQNNNSENNKLPKFHIIAYTGESMIPCNWYDPVVIDLNGIKLLTDKIPIRMNHDATYGGIGHAENVYVKDGKLQADIVVSRTTDEANEVVESARNGFPWQISVGGRPLITEDYDEGTLLNANGKTFKGPLVYVKEFELCEMSFCDLGADHRTSASISASRFSGENKMSDQKQEIDAGIELDNVPQEEIVEASLNEETLIEESEKPAETESEEVVVEAEIDVAEQIQAEKENVEISAAKNCGKKGGGGGKKGGCKRTQEEIAAASEKNVNRIAAINSIECSGFEEIRAQAIEEGWSFSEFNTALKAAKHDANIPNPTELPKGNKKMNASMNDNVIEAALVLETLGDKVAQKHFDSEDLNMANDIRRKLRCFRDVFAYATQSPFYKDDLRDMQTIQGAFTTSGLEKIFRNVVNKSMLAGYNTVGDTWRKICSVSRANDFKPIYNYRMEGDFTYKQVDNNDGEISNARFGEQEYTNTLKTFALKFSLTRAMLYNDDLNALTELPKQLGIGAGETLNNAVFELLLSNPTGADGNAFFSAAHNNYEAATSEIDPSLSIASLGRASVMFETQTTTDGRPIVQEAKYLVVPSALRIKAWNIMNSITVNEDTAVGDPQGVNNPFAGRYEVVASPYLQSPRYANSSATDWYLFGDPGYVSALNVVFLNGVEQPTIEQGDVSFDRLGIQYRGVFDFGVALQDWRGAVLMNV